MPVGLPAIQAVGGVIQSIFGGIQAKKAQKQIEKLSTPYYTQSNSILDYYNKALQRYSANPYNSNLYNLQNQNIQRGTAQGLNSLRQGRGAISGVSNLIQGQNDALLKAAATAEAQGRQDLSVLGNAAGMKAGENRLAYQYNQLAPYERKYNLLASKASGGNAIMNAGLSNVFGGLQSAGQYQMAKSIFGDKKINGNGPLAQLPYAFPQ